MLRKSNWKPYTQHFWMIRISRLLSSLYSILEDLGLRPGSVQESLPCLLWHMEIWDILQIGSQLFYQGHNHDSHMNQGIHSLVGRVLLLRMLSINILKIIMRVTQRMRIQISIAQEHLGIINQEMIGLTQRTLVENQMECSLKWTQWTRHLWCWRKDLKSSLT